jgi:hypothetical protein
LLAMRDKREARIVALEQSARENDDRYWKILGQLNALELIAMVGILDMSNTQENPFQWIQAYVRAMRQTTSTLTLDTTDPEKHARSLSETKDAIDNFLRQLIQHSRQVPGSPWL